MKCRKSSGPQISDIMRTSQAECCFCSTLRLQVRTHADTAFYMGVIDQQQRAQAHMLEARVVRLIR